MGSAWYIDNTNLKQKVMSAVESYMLELEQYEGTLGED